MAAFGTPATADERIARWRAARANPQNTLHAIVCDDAVVGFAGSFMRGNDCEVTYWVAREHWGRGVATRALSLLVVEETRRPLFGRVAADNIASQRVLRKCGFAMSGRARAHAAARGVEIDELIYRLDRAPSPRPEVA